MKIRFVDNHHIPHHHRNSGSSYFSGKQINCLSNGFLVLRQEEKCFSVLKRNVDFQENVLFFSGYHLEKVWRNFF